MPKVVKAEGNGFVSWKFWCPACQEGHSFRTVTPDGKSPIWTFDGNEESPTFQPSLLLFYTHPETNQRKTICHLNLTKGILIYHGDCPHAMKNTQVPLPEYPPDYG